ncbi:MAG: ABC transporter permease [Saprospiraceae bacterium]|nr:ABC transporter permease [Saprospiraceae bacterium]MCF8251420.1 ABC transporter permease [Saprospiraceae bacterium]MCF8312694.1 ABC transporter permease [Saprospiraceae bacterium]MCF8441040.1 ABC transporter permease [Saprospiraceae bacterium]
MDTPKHQLVITPGLSSANYWKDIYRYRELFYMLSWRDIKVRYKQTAIGVLWSVLRPLLTMAILVLVFGYFAKLPTSGDYPYPLLVLAGLIPWQFFANATSESGNSLLDNQNLITKVYFPRIIIPLSATVTSFVDFLIALMLFLPLMLIYRFTPSWHIVFIPAFTILIFLLSFGFGTILTALNVKYRDFRYVLPFIVQIGLYLSPVGYSTEIVPLKAQWLYSLNPMVGIIEGFRWCLLGESSLQFGQLMVSLAVTFFILALGIRYFRKTEKYFADLI